MATQLSALRTKVTITFKQTDNSQGVNTVTSLVDLGARSTQSWAIGSNSVNSCNQSFVPATYTLAGGNTTTIDLTNSTANKTPTNIALTLARCKIFYASVPNSTATTNGVLVNGVLINGLVANSTLNLVATVHPGGEVFWRNPTANGNTVDSTHKLITLTNLDATNSATVVLGVFGAQT